MESVLNWSRSHSLTPLILNAGCCAASGIEAGIGPRHDLDEFGGGVPHYAPEHADLLIVAGPLTPRRASVIARTYAAMAEPKWVVAYGACACSGGAYDDPALSSGLGTLLPVDIFIPGCPPRSEALLDGLSKLRARIRGIAASEP
jgi:NADH-quinone oxidoreductase subunit B